MTMDTLQIRMPEEQIEGIDLLVKKGEYASRSEAIRTMIREYESIKETIEVFSDPVLVRGIKKGLKEIKEGKIFSLEEVINDVRDTNSPARKKSS